MANVLSFPLSVLLPDGLLNYHSPGRQSRRPVSLLSFWVGVIPPTILSGSSFFMLPQFVISNLVRFDRCFLPGQNFCLTLQAAEHSP